MTSDDAGDEAGGGAGRGRRRIWVDAAVNLAGPAAFIATYVASHQLVDATWGLLGGSLLSIAVGWATKGRLAPLPLVLGLLAAIFGGLTLAFADTDFIKLQTTVESGAIGLTLLVTLAIGLNPLQAVFGRLLRLPGDAWRSLALRLGLFQIAIAVLNAVVWRTQPDAVWATFRFPVLPILHVLFYAVQVPLIARSRRRDAGAAGDRHPLEGRGDARPS